MIFVWSGIVDMNSCNLYYRCQNLYHISIVGNNHIIY